MKVLPPGTRLPDESRVSSKIEVAIPIDCAVSRNRPSQPSPLRFEVYNIPTTVPSGSFERAATPLPTAPYREPSRGRAGWFRGRLSGRGRPRVVRSLALTSESLGLTATLDLAEISGQVAVPIEYRKGRPKRVAMGPPPDDPGEAEEAPLSHPEAWPTDRIQVGLQAVLLEGAGYAVPEAVIYYAEEKLRLKITVDDAFKSEALKTLESAKQCAEGSRPLPFVNDSRCPRCSLQSVCLPDEVNHQRAQSPSGELTPRKIWPPRDEGISCSSPARWREGRRSWHGIESHR